MPETFLYTSRDGEFNQIAVEGVPHGGWPARYDAELEALKREWVHATQGQAGRVAGTTIGALVRAVCAAGSYFCSR